MDKKIVIPIILFGLLLSCGTGIELNLTCWVKETSETFKAKSELIGEKQWTIVNLTWGWTINKPNGDSVIVERSFDSLEYDFLASTGIDTVMSYTDQDTILEGSQTLYYQLSFVNGNEINKFEDLKVTTAPELAIFEPRDTVSIPNDTLYIRWAPTSLGGNFRVEIFKAHFTEPESLINLVNPLFSDTTSEASIRIEVPDSIFPPNNVYTIKVMQTRLVEFVTDTSIGFTAFFRLP